MRSTLGVALASTAVLALAACNRSAQPPASAEPPAAPAALPGEAAAPAAAPLAAEEAAAPIAPPAPPALASAAPDIGYAQAYDEHIEQGSGYDAWRYEQDGHAWRAWEDPRYGWRISEPGPQGEVIYYYRPGASEPYLVRQGGVFFVFSAGRLQRAYGPGGRAVTITAEMRNRRARDLAERARRARQQAAARAERKEARQDRLADRREERQDRRQERREDRRDDRRADERRTPPTPSGPVNPRPGQGPQIHPPRTQPLAPHPAPTRPGEPVNPRPEARPGARPERPRSSAQPAGKPEKAAPPAKKPDAAEAKAKAKCEKRAEKGKPAAPGCPS